jgi:hypothetical protein
MKCIKERAISAVKSANQNSLNLKIFLHVQGCNLKFAA